MRIRITNNCFVAGEPRAIKDEIEVDDELGNELMLAGKAVKIDQAKKPAKKSGKTK